MLLASQEGASDSLAQDASLGTTGFMKDAMDEQESEFFFAFDDDEEESSGNDYGHFEDSASTGLLHSDSCSMGLRIETLENDEGEDIEHQLPALSQSMPSTLSMSSSWKKSSLKRGESSNSLRRNVSFTEVKLREYDIAISDHPGCSYGPPIQLGWEYNQEKVVPLDSFEDIRSSQRRDKQKLVLSHNVRRKRLLKHGGCSSEDLEKAMKEVDRSKRDRYMTKLFLPLSMFEEASENVGDYFKQ